MKIGFVYCAPFNLPMEEVFAQCEPFLKAIGKLTEGAAVTPAAGYWAPTDEFEWAFQVWADVAPDQVDEVFNLVEGVAMRWGEESNQQAVALLKGEAVLVLPVQSYQPV